MKNDWTITNQGDGNWQIRIGKIPVFVMKPLAHQYGTKDIPIKELYTKGEVVWRNPELSFKDIFNLLV